MSKLKVDFFSILFWSSQKTLTLTHPFLPTYMAQTLFLVWFSLEFLSASPATLILSGIWWIRLNVIKTYSSSKWNLASISCYVKYEVHGALKEGHEAR